MLRRMYSSAIVVFVLLSMMVPTGTPAGAPPVNEPPAGTTGGLQSQSIVSHWEGTIWPDEPGQSGAIEPGALGNNTLSFDPAIPVMWLFALT